MSDFVKDVRYGFRMLWKAKGFTAVAVVSLALGIGLNTTIFSAVDAVLLRPKAGLEPERLVEVYLSDSSGYPYGVSSYPDYREYRDRSDAFSGIASSQGALARYVADGGSEYLIGELVSGSFFEVMGIPPRLGRVLGPDDDVSPGGHPVVMVSEGFWRGRLGGDSSAIGSTIELNGLRYTIVGVAPEEFTGGIPGIAMQFWAPSAMVDHLHPSSREGESRLERRTNRSVTVRGRLAAGVSLERAQAQMDSVMARLQEEFPDAYRDRAVHLVPSEDVRIHPFVDEALFPVATLLLVVVGLVLVIACANVANMLLARASARRSEVALRLALGSSRFRLVRQLLTESVLVSSLSGVVGLFIAWAATKALLAFKPPLPVPIALDLTLNSRVLLFTLGVSVATGILFGLAPALQASRRSLLPALKSEVGLVGASSRHVSLKSLLVVAQVSLSLVLLIGAALLLRSASNAQAIDPGFETERIVMFMTHLGLHGYTEETGREFYRSALARIEALPGVEATALAGKVPLGASVETRTVAPEGQEPEREADWPEVDATDASSGYFEVMGIGLVHGRDFDENDGKDSPPVVVVNETAARRFWPGESPVGKRLVSGSISNRQAFEVIGVVRDSKVRTLGENPRPQVYWAAVQDYSPMMYILARTSGPPEPALELVRRELLSMDATLAFFEAKTMRQNLAITLFPVRMGAILLGAFGGLALLLASVGLYGVVSYGVSRRTREIGIRMALGANRGDITGLVTRQGVGLVLIGVLLGWTAAFFGARALAAVLYGIEATDVVTFAAAALVLLGVAGLANWIPARRASRIPPVSALRYE